jgi:ABC-type branched-subunit amino acid transport system substrate-binding protein
MHFVRVRRTAAFAAVLLAATAVSTATAGAGTTTVVVPRGQPLQIALANDLTGFASAFSGSVSNAVRMAVAAHPTLHGFPIQIATYDAPCGDTAADVATAVAITADPQSAGVIGQLCSAGFDQALPVYEAAGVVTITGSASDAALPGFGPTVFDRTAVADPNFDAWYGTVKTLPTELAWQHGYELLFGEPPLDFADLYYDATSVLLRSLSRVAHVSRAGALVIDRAALARDVRSTRHFAGVSCTVTLDRATGNRVNDPASLARCAADDADWSAGGRSGSGDDN